MSIGEKVKIKRLQQGLRQEDLASMVGVTKSMIGQVERGTKSLSVSTCKDIARALNCTIEEIIND